MKRLVLASGNAGKLREIRQLLEPLGIAVAPQSDFDLDSAEETGTTFVENALIKAHHVARHTGLPVLADDSGLLVDALDGEPGVRSARYAGADASDTDNVNRLLRELSDVDDGQRTARFHCSLVLLRFPADPAPLICEGQWPGTIARAPAGEGGFGYDPVFLDPELDRTAAQLEPDEKHVRSHRGRAIARVLERLKLNT